MGDKTTKATRGAALALLLTLTGCAGLGAKKSDDAPITARCNEQPQWTTTDEKGQAIGIYVCFGERSQLLYVARVLPPAPPAAAPAPKVKQPRDPKTGRFVKTSTEPSTAPEPKK